MNELHIFKNPDFGQVRVVNIVWQHLADMR